MIVFLSLLMVRLEHLQERSVEIEYWSTLTTKGRRDVAREEEAMASEVEKGFVSLCSFLADETNCNL